jgi:hypothetical protein
MDIEKGSRIVSPVEGTTMGVTGIQILRKSASADLDPD